MDPLTTTRFPQRFCICEYVRTTSVPYGTSPASLVIKTLTILGCFLDNVGYRDVPLLDRYFALLLEGTDVSFAEVARLPTCLLVPLLTFTALDQGFHFCESIHDRNEALEAILFIGQHFPALSCNK